MLPRKEEAPKGTRVSLTLAHRMDFRRMRPLDFAGQRTGKAGTIKSKGSRRLPRIPLKSLADTKLHS